MPSSLRQQLLISLRVRQRIRSAIQNALHFRTSRIVFILSTPEMYDIPYRTIPLNPDFGLPLEALMEPSAGLILANPNAPTGIAIDLATISLLAASDPNRLLIIDEAYVDFGAESAVVLLEKHDNILVVQTCSKSPVPGRDAGRLRTWRPGL